MDNNKIISEVDSLKTRVMLLEKLVLSLIEENDLHSKGLLTDKQKQTSNLSENNYLDPLNPRRRII
jgi:hypothetical protein